MKFIKHFLLIGIVLISMMNVMSQAPSKPALKLKVDKVSVRYRDLVTDDKGAVNKNENELYALNKLVRDSVIVWAKKFNLNSSEGFEQFAAYAGKKLDLRTGKKITVDFIDLTGKEESYNILALGNDKYNIEEAKIIKR